MLKSSALETSLDDGSASKPSARQRLMDASEQLFAEHGWNAVSIRTIVAAAGVNLAALHYHFGSKEQLLSEIFAARAKPIALERIRLLSAIDLENDPSLERILEAFLRPALTIGSDVRFGGRAFVKLRARLATEPEAVSRRILANAFDESSGEFLHALARALPEIPQAELEWRFHFMLGTMFYTMADAGRIQSLTNGRCDPGRVEDALAHIIPFLAAGFRSKPELKSTIKSRRRPK
ncbi:AcrR family transcriptional regulator [Nitrobacteraceae bacterium AZCC 2161]